MTAPFESGIMRQSLQTEKLKLSVIAGRIDDVLNEQAPEVDEHGEAWQWLCGFCTKRKDFFYYRYGRDEKTSVAQWHWPVDRSGMFELPIAFAAGR